jgi:putative ABC transport system permease protein
MSLFRIAWRSIERRWLASLLTSLSMALGVALVVSVLLILGIVSDSFRNNSALGYNMILGAKGGKLQLVLNTVYYLSAPVENIPYTFYQEFLPAPQRGDGRDGQYAELVEFAIPLCLGDYYEGYRVVGTIPAMFDDFVYDAQKGKKYTFAAGRNFRRHTPEHGFFEAVIGSVVARDTGLRVGDTFSPTHGPEGEAHDDFFVVGILSPSGTPNDRAVFVNMEGFYLLEGHARPEKGQVENGADDVRPDITAAPSNQTHDPAKPGVSKLDEHRRHLQPLPIPQREVTAVLLRTVNTLVAPGLQNTINEGAIAQAVMPIAEIYVLFHTIVGPIQWVLLVITMMVCVVSGVSILVSIYNSMSDRRHEIAVMRALGAGRRTVMVIVLLESLLLALAGGCAGWIAGHTLIGGLASSVIEERTGVTIGVFDFAPAIKPFESLGVSPIMNWGISTEVLLIPGLVLLAVAVGFLPAVAAYRTDVGRALSAAP